MSSSYWWLEPNIFLYFIKGKLQLTHLWFGENLSVPTNGLKFDTLPTWD